VIIAAAGCGATATLAPHRPMQLAFAFLADAAQFSPDGKVSLLGGDFDTVYAESFPSQHPDATLVVKLKVQPTECNRDHRLRVEFIDSDGNRVIPSLELPFKPELRPEQPHRPVGVGLALQLRGLPIAKEGDYAFHVLVDDLEVAVVELKAVVRRTKPSPSWRELIFAVEVPPWSPLHQHLTFTKPA
jgi:hypothetical protein